MEMKEILREKFHYDDCDVEEVTMVILEKGGKNRVRTGKVYVEEIYAHGTEKAAYAYIWQIRVLLGSVNSVKKAVVKHLAKKYGKVYVCPYDDREFALYEKFCEIMMYSEMPDEYMEGVWDSAEGLVLMLKGE